MMPSDKASFSRKTVGRAGIAWAIIQFLSLTLGTFPLYLYMHVLTPPWLVAATWGEFLPRSSFAVVYFVSGLILLLLIIGLTIGVYRKKFVCALLLLLDVAVYLIVAFYGLFFENTFVYDSNTYLYFINAIYIGIMVIILLFIASGIWGRSPRTSKLVKLTSAIVLFLAISIPLLIMWVSNIQLGSISGNIYHPDNTVYDEQVGICCKPLNVNTNITHGDPAPPYLFLHASGSYKIDDLPEGDYYLWVVAPDDNLFSDGFRLVSVQSQENSNIDFKLVPGGSISGGFLDKGRNPVSGAGGNKWVAMYSIPAGWHYSINVAPDGTYSLENLLPGEYQIYSNLIQTHNRVTIESGQESHFDFSIR
jgi:hypothetical protein